MLVSDAVVRWTRMLFPLKNHLVHLVVTSQVTPGQFSRKHLQDNLASYTGKKK
jgi:hypothetical protein